MPLSPGDLVDQKYRVIGLIGEGGMGAVYEGENLRISRRVAIKVLHAAFTGNRDAVQRFEREAQAAGRIGNDHILEVLDLGSLSDGDTYMVMEFLDGEALSDRIKRTGHLTPAEVTPLARQILTGLAAAHGAGIIHRDLKPENIFVLKEKAGRPDFIKIIDFGISKFQALGGDGLKMTRTGAVMGTPYYMSPEQASGSTSCDHRSDIYSVGVILYEAVSGRVPFDAGTFNQLMFQIVLSEVPTLSAIVPDIDPAFASIVAKAMARDVNARFQTCQEFRAALDAWVEHGAAVTVPPDAGGGTYMPGRLSSLGQIPGGTTVPARTTGAASWETSPSDVPKKSAAPLVVTGVLGALLLLGGGGFAAYRWLGAEPAEAEQVATEPSAAESSLSAADTEPKDIEAGPERPEVVAAPVEAAPSSEPSADPKAAASAGDPVTPAVKTARPVVKSRPAATPKSQTVAPVEKKASTEKKAPRATSGGAIDFGY
jgi:serine/threonine-protein kinase